MRFKIGDRVWSVGNGWGEVVATGDDTSYPIRVKYPHHNITYTNDGKYTLRDISTSLFFEEIAIPETALVRKRWRAYTGEPYYYIGPRGEVVRTSDEGVVFDDTVYNVGNYFKTEKDAMESKFYKVFHD